MTRYLTIAFGPDEGVHLQARHALRTTLAFAPEPREAAKELGAQVLFQINSLEKVEFSLGKDARWERRYFEASKCGQPEGPVALPENELRSLRSLTQGVGYFTMEPSHYDPVPPHTQQQLVGQHKVKEEE